MANNEIRRSRWIRATLGALIAGGMILVPPAGVAFAAPGANQGDNGNHGQGNNGNHGQDPGGGGPGGGDPGGGDPGGGDPGGGDPGGGDLGGGDPGGGDPGTPGDPGIIPASSDILPCAPELDPQTPCLALPQA
jgi:hypothetical protein